MQMHKTTNTKGKYNSKDRNNNDKTYHKHQWQRCMFTLNEKGKRSITYPGHYCKVCGRIKDLQSDFDLDNYLSFKNRMSMADVQNMKHFELRNYWQKYVDVDEEREG